MVQQLIDHMFYFDMKMLMKQLNIVHIQGLMHEINHLMSKNLEVVVSVVVVFACQIDGYDAVGDDVSLMKTYDVAVMVLLMKIMVLL
jgi:hypothetical protein